MLGKVEELSPTFAIREKIALEAFEKLAWEKDAMFSSLLEKSIIFLDLTSVRPGLIETPICLFQRFESISRGLVSWRVRGSWW